MPAPGSKPFKESYLQGRNYDLAFDGTRIIAIGQVEQYSNDPKQPLVFLRAKEDW